MRAASPLGQEDVLYGPVKTAGTAQPGHVPTSRDNCRFGARKHPTPVKRTAIRPASRLAILDDLEAPQHPTGLLAAAAERPVPVDPVATLDRHRLAAALHSGAGDHG